MRDFEAVAGVPDSAGGFFYLPPGGPLFILPEKAKPSGSTAPAPLRASPALRPPTGPTLDSLQMTRQKSAIGNRERHFLPRDFFGCRFDFNNKQKKKKKKTQKTEAFFCALVLKANLHHTRCQLPTSTYYSYTVQPRHKPFLSPFHQSRSAGRNQGRRRRRRRQYQRHSVLILGSVGSCCRQGSVPRPPSWRAPGIPPHRRHHGNHNEANNGRHDPYQRAEGKADGAAILPRVGLCARRRACPRFVDHQGNLARA